MSIQKEKRASFALWTLLGLISVSFAYVAGASTAVGPLNLGTTQQAIVAVVLVMMGVETMRVLPKKMNIGEKSAEYSAAMLAILLIFIVLILILAPQSVNWYCRTCS